jgi:uncharacterized protein YgbK (DUF1537 family)
MAGSGFFLCDAATDQELQTIVAAGRRLVGPLLWIGTAGLARALAGPFEQPAPAMLPSPLLLVVGSHHPVTLAQLARLSEGAAGAITMIGLADPDVRAAIAAVDAALAAGRRAALVFALPDGTGAATAGPLFERAMRLAAERLPAPGSLVVSGGATLFQLARTVGARALLVTGELTPGVALSRFEGGLWPGATVISKSGAFGTPDLLVRWWHLAQP